MTTYYEKLGGQDAVAAVVDRFYEKVLADERINRFFEHTDIHSIAASLLPLKPHILNP